MEMLKNHILQLENDLLRSETRKACKKINDILADDFIEFCSSGSEYHYKNGDIFHEENDNSELQWEILDFQIKELSNNCILAMYQLAKQREVNKAKECSLRSSIWKFYDGKWKMIFHQGTLR